MTVHVMLLFILWQFLSLILILMAKEDLERRKFDLTEQVPSREERESHFDKNV